MTHSNVQIYLLKIVTKEQRSFIVGTHTQRGFTQAGVTKTLEQVKPRLPKGWTVEIITVSPLSSLF